MPLSDEVEDGRTQRGTVNNGDGPIKDAVHCDPLVMLYCAASVRDCLAWCQQLFSRGKPLDCAEMQKTERGKNARLTHVFVGQWREKMFAQMHLNASSAADFLNLPSNSVVELGSKIEI